MYKKNVILSALLAMIISLPLSAATVALWDFEDGVAGQAFTPTGAANGSGGSADLVNGVMMYGWDDYNGPYFTDDTPYGISMDNADNHQDGYVPDETLASWSPSVWTIECSVYLEEIKRFLPMVI